MNKRSPIRSLLTGGSDQTINEPEENLSAYFEPFGLAMVPASPGNRDSIASCESDSLLVAEKKDEEVNLWFSLLCRWPRKVAHVNVCLTVSVYRRLAVLPSTPHQA